MRSAEGGRNSRRLLISDGKVMISQIASTIRVPSILVVSSHCAIRPAPSFPTHHCASVLGPSWGENSTEHPETAGIPLGQSCDDSKRRQLRHRPISKRAVLGGGRVSYNWERTVRLTSSLHDRQILASNYAIGVACAQ